MWPLLEVLFHCCALNKLHEGWWLWINLMRHLISTKIKYTHTHSVRPPGWLMTNGYKTIYGK